MKKQKFFCTHPWLLFTKDSMTFLVAFVKRKSFKYATEKKKLKTHKFLKNI